MSIEAGSSKSGSISSHSFDEYNANIQGAALNTTKLAAALPTDVTFHRSVDNDFAQAIDSCSEKALRLTNRLLALSETRWKLEDQEDVVDSFQSTVVDALDQLYESADMSLDEFLGRSKPIAMPLRPTPQASASTSCVRQGRLDPAIMHASHIAKPQLKFRRKVDNTNDARWSASLKHKYNAQVPLGYALHDAAVDGQDYESIPKKPHPYRYEIEHIPYPRRMFEHMDAIHFKSFDNTPFVWIDTKTGLDSLLDKLRRAHEIAVDLEHHSYRSFSGFLCLMQISTREEDFVVDTLALREELEDLNEVFTDPKIVKVFHGAESDIVWLQQDFNIYIVNLFDTFHASRLLDFPKHGLAALLEMYCDFIPDKRYQLADWRIRPLPSDMLKYARSDTHFLLYIYDNLRNALLDRAGGQSDLIRAALGRSEETALRTYEREVYDIERGAGPGGWDTLAQKWGRALSGMPLAVFRAVHAWRDRIAREEDESTRYVLPNHYLFKLAEQPPADMTALLGTFRPVPALVRTKAASLLDTIRVVVKEHLTKTRDGGKSKASEQELGAEVEAKSAEVTPAPPLSEKTAKALPDLWAAQASTKLTHEEDVTATSSTLLGSKTKAKSQREACFSERSYLFPTGWFQATTQARETNTSMRYREVVTRIHGALVIAPSLPKKANVTVNETEGIDRSDVSKSVPSPVEVEQIEIPFIPARQRQQHVMEEKEDSIVVVGKARQKKRKRSKQDTETEGVEGETKKAKGQSEMGLSPEASEAEPFDYASAPNFLDEPLRDKAATLKNAKMKVKNSKVRAFEYGNFPAPPRAYNEVKGGNKSQTFRS
ncbi:ribonuclease H-like domain-containing protein [Phellopilus nigrolimitatus]|nr:ribonuclease H-like domain-containing protein [Phellopilus nigrolimitatus]